MLSIGAGKSHVIAVVNRDLFSSLNFLNSPIDFQASGSTKSDLSNLVLPPTSASLIQNGNSVLTSSLDASTVNHSETDSTDVNTIEISLALFRLLFPSIQFHPSLFQSLLRLAQPVLRQVQIVTNLKNQLFGEQSVS